MGAQPLHYDGKGYQVKFAMVWPKCIIPINRPVTANAVRPTKSVEPM